MKSAALILTLTGASLYLPARLTDFSVIDDGREMQRLSSSGAAGSEPLYLTGTAGLPCACTSARIQGS